MSATEDPTGVILPADAYYELSPEDVMKWCQKAVKVGYLRQIAIWPIPLFMVTEAGGEYLEKTFKDVVTKSLIDFGLPYTPEDVPRILELYKAYKSQTNPVLCIVQSMYEDFDRKQSMN